MKHVSLREFRRAAGLSDTTMISLLERNALTCILDPVHGILVDLEDVSNQKLVEKIIPLREQVNHQEEKLLIERAAKIIRNELDSILDEAIELAKIKSE